MLKRARRFIVIESVDKSQALVEKFLGLRVLCRNRVMEIPQPAHQRYRTGLGSRRVRALLRQRSYA